ncbi:hypothetical protein F4780DRAFT_754258 [Xylariomycetidae sp. FL0641]|nr:hypothetical protein F4780DRAFT_754258 [Xylariomycetidae sp. FL0641]
MGSIEEHVDVLVVGAGWNGLISAKTYLDFEPSANLVIVDDQKTIGGVWSAEKIYPTLYAQIKHGLFEYSFYPMRHEGITADGYVSAETIHTYLNDFAWDHDLVRRIRLETSVTGVSRLEDASWRVSLRGEPSIRCTKLIYAPGATSHPVMPTYPSTNFQAPIIHSSDMGAHLDSIGTVKSVTVVGGAKSAYDTVFLLLKEGKKVNWIIRDDGSGPLAIMPPTLLGLRNTMDVVSTRFMALMGASIMSTDGRGHQFFQRTAVGRFLAWLFWLVVNWIASRHAGYSKSENAEKLRPMPFGNGIFWANAGLGAASVPLFWKTFHAGDCTVHRGDIDSLSAGNRITLKDESSFTTDFVILSTGFDKPFQVFSEELQRRFNLAPNPTEQEKWAELESRAERTVDELLPALKGSPFGTKQFRRERSAGGRKLLHGPNRHYRRLIVPALAAKGDRSIFFPGFIHSIYTPLVSEVQALWGVAFLLGLLDPPSQEEMEREVAEWNVWSRKRYKAQGTKHAYAIFDFLPYIDTLLKDLGINPRRKKNPLAHLFMPAYPREYKGLMGEFLEAQMHRRPGTAAIIQAQTSAKARVADEKGANGHAVNGHAVNGHAINGDAVNGHAVNGHGIKHGINGHAVNGHGINGFGINGDAVNGHAINGKIDRLVETVELVEG